MHIHIHTYKYVNLHRLTMFLEMALQTQLLPMLLAAVPNAVFPPFVTVCCSVLQCVALCYCVVVIGGCPKYGLSPVCYSVLQCVAVCYCVAVIGGCSKCGLSHSVLQRVTLCCSALLCCSYWRLSLMRSMTCLLHRVAPCCTVLHRVAPCCTVLHRVAPCCTGLHRVAPCCSRWQQATIFFLKYVTWPIHELDTLQHAATHCKALHP